MNAELVASYETLPYGFYCYRDTQPPELYALARLFGLKPRPLAGARVLELGCARGGNLLPFALEFPDAECVGVDAAAGQIDTARAVADELSLRNVRFEARDLRALGRDLGAFDYVICHGVYSWVPPDAQDAILRVCGELLHDDGVAVVSYNALPGWHWVQPLRDFMLLATRGMADPAARARRGRELLGQLAGPELTSSDVLRTIAGTEHKLLAAHEDNYFAHDHLEVCNRAVYLSDFVRRAQGHGLRYVGDTQLTKAFGEHLAPAAQQWLGGVGERALREQHQDFLVGQRFRSSVLCRARHAVRDTLDAGAVLDLCVAFPFGASSPVPATVPAGVPDTVPEEMAFSRGDLKITVKGRIPVATCLELVAHEGRAVAGDALLAGVRARLPGAGEHELRRTIGEFAASLLRRGYLRATAQAPRVVAELGARPVAWPLARVAAARFDDERAFSCAHQCVKTDALARRLLVLLDGTRDRGHVVNEMLEAVLAGELPFDGANARSGDREAVRALLEPRIGQALEMLRGTGFLVG